MKRRVLLGLTQREVGVRLTVKEDTYLLWEKDRAKPTARYYPTILNFLGYDPLPPPATLAARIARKRLELGLSIEQAAQLLGVDEGTFGRWERGEWKPRLSSDIVNRFLAMPPDVRTGQHKDCGQAGQ